MEPKIFIDDTFLRSILETSHEAVAESVAEAVSSPLGVEIFGEAATVLGTWDSHVIVGAPGGVFHRAEFRAGGAGVEFFDVSPVAIPKATSFGVAGESVALAVGAADAILEDDLEGASALAEELLDMVHAGIPVTKKSFAECARGFFGSHFQIGHVAEDVQVEDAEASPEEIAVIEEIEASARLFGEDLVAEVTEAAKQSAPFA